MGFCELACIQITLNGIPPVHGPFKLSSLLVMWAQTVISVWPSIDTCVCVCVSENRQFPPGVSAARCFIRHGGLCVWSSSYLLQTQTHADTHLWA